MQTSLTKSDAICRGLKGNRRLAERGLALEMTQLVFQMYAPLYVKSRSDDTVFEHFFFSFFN